MRCARFPLALLPLVAACGGGGGERTAVLRADVVGTLDDPASPPRIALTQATQLGLVQFDGRGQVVPGLAASWRVVDGGRSIIFRLRPAKWSDGRALKAKDVVAVFQRIMAPGSRNTLKPLLSGIDNAASTSGGRAPMKLLGVSAPLEMVVEIRLASPDAGLLQLLALPQAAIVRGESRPPAIGAFVVADAGARPIVLARNTQYFAADTTRLGGVALTAAPDAPAAVARFAHGQTDLVTGDGIAGLGEAVTVAAPSALRLEPTWGVYGYRANLKSGPLADARVRRALAMSVDRAGLLARLFRIPAMVPLVSLVPPDASDGAGPPAVPDWTAIEAPARRALAAQLLGAAGYGPDKPLRLTIGVPPGYEHARIADAAARDWAALGVVAQIVERAPEAQRRAVARGDFDLAVVERTAPAPNALFFLRPFTCKGSGGTYCNPGADALIDGARTMADEDARAEALAHAEAAMLADTPMIALFVPVRWALVARGVTGWTINQGGQHPLAALDIAKESRK